MLNTINSQTIIDSLETVEHPAIAATLLDLGMLRDIAVTSDFKAILTMVLPFPSIPNNVRSYMVSSLTAAAKSTGGELTKVNIAVMDEAERQNFLTKEQQNWRG